MYSGLDGEQERGQDSCHHGELERGDRTVVIMKSRRGDRTVVIFGQTWQSANDCSLLGRKTRKGRNTKYNSVGLSFMWNRQL